MRTQLLVAAVLAVAAAVGAEAAIHWPSTPFAFSSQQKHSVLSSRSVVVGKANLLASNDLGADGGYNLLTRTGGPGAPGAVVDVNGATIQTLGPGNTRGVGVSVWASLLC